MVERHSLTLPPPAGRLRRGAWRPIPRWSALAVADRRLGPPRRPDSRTPPAYVGSHRPSLIRSQTTRNAALPSPRTASDLHPMATDHLLQQRLPFLQRHGPHVLVVREHQIERDKDWRASTEREIVQHRSPGLPERSERHLRVIWFARGEGA